MLPRAHRLVDGRGFTAATRGRRAGGRGVVVHRARDDEPSPDAPAQVGLIVSRAVGGSVQRNQVKRRLRHQLRGHVGSWPAGATVAVRALPASAGMSSAELARDLDRCLARLDLPRADPTPGAADEAHR